MWFAVFGTIFEGITGKLVVNDVVAICIYSNHKGAPWISRKEVCSVLRSNNISGMTGVCTYAKRYRRRDDTIKENWYWEARWA